MVLDIPDDLASFQIYFEVKHLQQYMHTQWKVLKSFPLDKTSTCHVIVIASSVFEMHRAIIQEHSLASTIF